MLELGESYKFCGDNRTEKTSGLWSNKNMYNICLCTRYQQYTNNKHVPDRECMVQQEYEVDQEDAYDVDKVYG